MRRRLSRPKNPEVNLIELSPQTTQLLVVGAIPPTRIRSLETYSLTAPPPEGEQAGREMKSEAGAEAGRSAGTESAK